MRAQSITLSREDAIRVEWLAVDSPTEILYERQQPILVLRSAVLRVTVGADAGASCALSCSRVVVGSAEDNDLKLSDPKVSRHHLEFQVRDRGFLLRDLQSTNGTFYRGARVSEALVGQGAEVRLGSTVLRLERGPETSEVVGCKRQFGSLIGSSQAMQQVYGLLAAVAPTDTTVLIEGETGTGKELVAEELHRHSPRRERPFDVVDCGGLPGELIESELLGHERGAFTGAVADREGVFERARGGTVFLDEIGELPLALQSRLLGVLERRTIRRVGGNLPRKVDFRLVAATNRDLHREVREGRFRQDLYYRLAVVRVVVPPLRERAEDIPPLARHFLWQAGCADAESVLTAELLRVLRSRSWPGNVRELRNVIERATILVDGSDLVGDAPLIELKPSSPRESAAAPAVDAPPALTFPPSYLEMDYKAVKELLLDQFEAQYLGRLVGMHGTNISYIARDAGVDRHLIRKLLRKHDLGK
jgi:DNA-binding NtrC family response regulator